jgi:hypothetical protein
MNLPIPTSTIFFSLAVVWTIVAFYLGTRVIASRVVADRSQSSSLWLSWSVVAVSSCWIVIVSLLGESGFLSAWEAMPPRLPLLPLSCLIAFVVIGRTRFVGQGLQHIAIVWPIAFQFMRVFIELGFWCMHIEGQAPVQVTWLGINHDLWVGVFAAIIALAVYLGWIQIDRVAGRITLLIWNFVCLGILAGAVFAIASSVPGPIFLDWPDGSFPSIVRWPAVWVPSFLAPMAVFVHVLSIRQCLSARQTQQSRNRQPFSHGDSDPGRS